MITFAYTAAGDLKELVDGKSQKTSWGYDLFGNMTSKTNAAGTEVLRRKYDAENRMTNRWTAAKLDTFYAYDAVGNLTNVNYASSPDLSFEYDALNRPTKMVDAVGTTLFTYTPFGALESEDGPSPTFICQTAPKSPKLTMRWEGSAPLP